MANLDKLKLVRDVGRREIVMAMARRPDSETFYLGGSEFKVYEMDLAQPKPEPKEFGAHASYVTGAALVGKTLVTGGYDGKLIWWDTDKRSQVRSVEAHAKWIRNVIASPDGSLIASVADDMFLKLWDPSSGKLVREMKGHEEKTPAHFSSMLHAVTFSPDGKHAATGDKVGHVVVWEVATGKQVSTMEAPTMYTWDPVQRRHSIGGIRSLAFSPDGTQLAVGGVGKIGNIDGLDGKARVEVFDWAKGKQTHEFPGDKFNGLVNRLAFDPKGEWLVGAGGSNDGFLMFFDLKAKKALRQEKVAFHVHCLSMNEAADTLYLAGHNKIAVFEMKG